MVGILLVAAVAVLVGREPAAPATMTAAWRQGLVVVSGTAPKGPVDVSATLEGGSGSALMTADDEGRYAVAFRPPAGVGGDVDVAAVIGEERLGDRATVVPEGIPPEAPSDLLVVPMTGRPASPRRPTRACRA